MILAAPAVVLGVLLGLASGGSFKSLAQVGIRFDWLLVVLFLIQGVARGRMLGAPLPGATMIWTIASVGIVVLLLLNRSLPGMLVAALGVLLNVDATLLNAGMPVLLHASALGPDAAIRASRGLYSAMNPSTIGALTGDVIGLNMFRQSLLLSPGDILLVVGICAAIVAGMVREPAAARAD